MKITVLSCSEYLLPDVMGLVLFGMFLLELLKNNTSHCVVQLIRYVLAFY